MSVRGEIAAPSFVGSSATLRRAFELAAQAHDGQTGSGGKWPYLRHPVRVAEILHATGIGGSALAAALLHDVVEETALTVEDVENEFGPRIAALVAALTDDPSISDWVARKDALRSQVEAAGSEAVAIYVADKLANVRDMRRLYEERGEEAIDLHRAPTLDLRVAAWRADSRMAEERTPQLELVDELVAELDAFDAERGVRTRRRFAAH